MVFCYECYGLLLRKNGCWLGLHGLSHHLWTSKIFMAIGDFCGGLIRISQFTTTLNDLTKARIMVKAASVADIPRVIHLWVRGSHRDIWVLILDGLNPNRDYTEPCLFMSEASSDLLGGEDDDLEVGCTQVEHKNKGKSKVGPMTLTDSDGIGKGNGGNFEFQKNSQN